MGVEEERWDPSSSEELYSVRSSVLGVPTESRYLVFGLSAMFNSTCSQSTIFNSNSLAIIQDLRRESLMQISWRNFFYVKKWR